MNDKRRVKLAVIELSQPLEPICRLDNYSELWVVTELHRIPLGIIKISLSDNTVSASRLKKLIVQQLGQAIFEHLLIDAALDPQGRPNSLAGWESLLAGLAAPIEECHYFSRFALAFQPSISLVICTRNRTASLARLLNSVEQLIYPDFEVLVIDNAPTDNSTAELLAVSFPHFRYILEPRPGLDHARNRGILEGRGEIIAFTDDDTVVDPYWLRALAASFETGDIMAVTGLVLPYELEHEAQQIFERYNGFEKGFRRRYWHYVARTPWTFYMFGAGEFGTGANMAFRRRLFAEIGLFDPALDVGTVTNGGGDLDIYFRTLIEKHTLAYEPAALVWHCHRAGKASLHYQINGWGSGVYAFLTAAFLRYPTHGGTAIRFAGYWFFKGLVKRFLKELRQPGNGLAPLALEEVKGAAVGPLKYLQARRAEKRTAAKFKTAGSGQTLTMKAENRGD